MYHVLTILCLLVFQLSQGQASFRAIVPQEPLVEGESFRVQFVVEGAETFGNFVPPPFRGFRIVNGPEVYSGQTGTGSSQRSLRNMVYTLQAMEPGHFYLQGATAVINAKTTRCNGVMIQVISKDEALRDKKLFDEQQVYDNSMYLKPGEDPYKKISQNLFMKVHLNKKTCYAGEPVVATFKLYSRLQSKSDIVKNPGFYGFAVQDMVNLDDHMVATEIVNGKMFDVHTVRKVQLYPLQAGTFIVDAMQVSTRVEFSRSVVNRKVEQEIVEGVFEHDDTPVPGIEVFEANTATKPVAVTVRPLPGKNKPEDFNDATGRFQITATLDHDILSRNEEGHLLVTIKGKGNFHQLVAPAINWPAGIEGFEPSVNDELDKLAVPLEGSRTFRYAFVTSHAGKFQLPEISITFFDPDSNKYARAVSKSVKLTVENREKARPEPVVEKKVPLTDINRKAGFVAAAIVGLMVIIALIYWIVGGRKKKPVIEAPLPEKNIPTVFEVVRPAIMLLPAADRDFYSALHQSIWNWLALKFELTGMGMSKESIIRSIINAGNNVSVANELVQVLVLCEAGMFTTAVMDADREELIRRVKNLLEELKA
jgi:hypothetical protein